MLTISVVVFGQGASIDRKRGVSFGFNWFPAAYLPLLGGELNQVYFGYHIGYFHELEKITLRGGVNFNAWGRKDIPYARINQVGLEIGIEKQLLKQERKWQLNVGANFYAGELWQIKPIFRRDDQWLMLGPNVLFGREIGAHWVIQSETSIGFGYSRYSFNTYGYDHWEFYQWKFFSLGARYSF